MYRGVVTAIGNGPLTPGVMGSNIGPEMGFGHVMGYYFGEPVIVLKSSQGNRSINWDFAPPSTPRFDYGGNTYAAYGESPNSWTTGTGPTPFVWYAGKQYDDCFLDEADMGPKMTWGDGKYFYRDNIQISHNDVVYISKLEHTASPDSEPGVGAQWTTYWNVYTGPTNVVDVLDNFATQYPQYAAQGFEIAGYGWWQGHKDGGEQGTGTAGIHATRYELNLTNFINDIRAYYETRYPANTVPDAPFVVATVGFGGGNWEPASSAQTIHDAQMAVGDPNQHPEFAGNVASVDTTGFWRDSSISPTTAGYHYNGNAETYMLVGDAMGRAMAELLTPYSVNAGPDMVTWSGESVVLDATVQEDITVTSYSWSAEPADGIVFDSNTIEDPTVTITKATDNPSTVRLRLTVNDGVNEPVTDSIFIDVYDDACKATRLGMGIMNKSDLDGNCITGLEELTMAAMNWLKDNSLTEPITKPEQ